MSSQSDIILPVLSALGTLVLGSIPVVTALLRIQSAISENKHRIAMLEQQQESADNVIALGLNQVKESVSHLGGRLKYDTRLLDGRLRDCEQFLAKELKFTIRNKE